MKTEKEKAEEILKKRERAKQGLAEEDSDGKDPLDEQEKREEEIADAGLAIGIGLGRSG